MDLTNINKNNIIEFINELKALLFPKVLKRNLSIKRLYIELYEILNGIGVEEVESITNHFFDNIIVEKVFASKSKTPLGNDCFTLWEDGAEDLPLVWLYNDINVTNLTLRDIVRTVETNTGVPLIKIEDDVKIARLVLDNISQNIKGTAVAPIVSVGVGVKEIKKVNMD